MSINDLFYILLYVFLYLTLCYRKYEPSTIINTASIKENNKELTCMMRALFTSFNNTTSDNKRCFMLSWGAHDARDIRERNLECTKEDEANAWGTDASDMKSHSNYCKRFVMLDKFNGRTGNQMFEVASLIGIAYRYDVIPIINTELPLLKDFNLPNQITGGRFKMINSSTCVPFKAACYDNCSKQFASPGNVTMKGFLQSWRYFDNVKDLIRMIFVFGATREIKVRNYLESISKEGYQRVCIHVRRTEGHGINYSLKLGYNPAGRDFFERAQQFYINKFSKVQFIVVTDDTCWCKKNLKDVEFSPFSDANDDLALMAMSDHVIVSRGTFGWWGAWLSGGTIVYYKGFPRKGSWLDSVMIRDDYYPPDWIGIS